MIEQLFWNNEASIERLAAILRVGQVAIGSSDTVFGLIANLKSQGRIALDTIKKRVDKPYIVLISQNARVADLVDQTHLLQIENLAAICWPGPVTLICRARADLPGFMKGPNGSIALRMPDHAGLQKLLTHFDGLFSTSANISGEPVPTSIDQVDPRVLEQCSALVLDGPNVARASQLPSTILDCTEQKIKVIREGAVPSNMILEKLEKSR